MQLPEKGPAAAAELSTELVERGLRAGDACWVEFDGNWDRGTIDKEVTV